MIQQLAQSDLFAGVPTEKIAHFVDCFQRQQHPADTGIIFEAERGNRLYIVESGRCEVVKRVIVNGEILTQRIGYLEVGQTFGEMELVDRQPRSATVRALTDVTTLSLSTVDLYERTQESADYRTFSLILINIAREISLRLRQTDIYLAGSLFCLKNS